MSLYGRICVFGGLGFRSVHLRSQDLVAFPNVWIRVYKLKSKTLPTSSNIWCEVSDGQVPTFAAWWMAKSGFGISRSQTRNTSLLRSTHSSFRLRYHHEVISFPNKSPGSSCLLIFFSASSSASCSSSLSSASSWSTTASMPGHQRIKTTSPSLKIFPANSNNSPT